jgi:hypothetical protein
MFQNSQSFLGIPVYVSDYAPKGSLIFVPEAGGGPYCVTDSVQTILDKLDEDFLRRCGIVKGVQTSA